MEVHRKVSRGIWKKSFTSKSEVLSEYSNLILSFIFFKILVFFTFPHLKLDWCVVWSQFFHWRKELYREDLPDTLNIVLHCTEQFIDAFERKVSPQKVRFSQNILTKPHFLRWNFFSKASGKSSVHFHTMFKVSGRSS